MADRFVVVSPDAQELPLGVADLVLKRAGDNSGWVLQDKFQLVAAALAAASAPIDHNGQRLTNLGAPTNANDAATKSYADALAQGLSVKPSVQAATTAALPAYTVGGGGATLTATANGAFPTIDGFLAALNNLYLVQNEATQVNNGLFKLTTLGNAGTPWVLTRTAELAVGAHADGAFVFVENGATYSGSGFVCVTMPGADVVGTNNLYWTQFSGAGEIIAGPGLMKSGNTLSALVDGVSIDAGGTGSSLEVKYGAALNMQAALSDAGAASAGARSDAARIDHQHVVQTAAPVAIGTANAQGSSASLARADHVHDHGQQASGSNGGLAHAVVISGGNNGFMSGSDKAKLDNLGGTFSGTLQTTDTAAHATTFDTLSTNNSARTYSMRVTGVKSDGSKGYSAEITVGVRRTGAGANVLIGSAQIGAQRDDTNWSVTIVLSGNNIQIQVQDTTSGETVNWRWRGHYAEAP